MLAIKNNLMAQGAARQLGKSYDDLSTSVRRLSSGLRIGSSKDDAAGLAVRELIRADVAALQQGSRNASDGVSMLQSAEGALGEIDAILVRMRELAEQASTGTYSIVQKGIMQQEYDELSKEITRIAETTDFNDINLLQGTGSVEITLGRGVTANQTITVEQKALDASSLHLDCSASVAGNVEIGEITEPVFAGKSSTNAFMTVDSGAGSAGNKITLAMTFDGTSHAFNLVAGTTDVISFDDVLAQFTNASFDTTSGKLQLSGSANGDVTDFAIDITGTTGSTLEWGTVGGTEVSDGAGAYTELTAGVADTASSKVALTDGTIAQKVVDEAIEEKDKFRAKLGYWMNRLEYASSVLDVQAENLMAAESRISDVDVATEMSAMTRNQVLAQAGISMLAQANSMPQMALSLLQ